jgi:hypothetical protein
MIINLACLRKRKRRGQGKITDHDQRIAPQKRRQGLWQRF